MTAERSIGSRPAGRLKAILPLVSGVAFAVVFLFLLWGADHVQAAETIQREDTDTFLAGVRAYESGDYAAAVEAFSNLVSRGYESGLLYFNLGNGYLKSGDLGRAILWYERALKRIPGNADLLYNLDYARALTRDEVENPEVPLGRILFFWKYRMSDRSVRWTALFFWCAFWTFLGLKRFSRGNPVRVAIVLTGFVAVLLVATAFYNYYEEAYAADAIILADEVAVRSGTDAASTELFRLHAGTRVEARRLEGSYALVFFTKDRVGWVPAQDIALVRGL